MEHFLPHAPLVSPPPTLKNILNPIFEGKGIQILFQSPKSFQTQHFRLKSCLILVIEWFKLILGLALWAGVQNLGKHTDVKLERSLKFCKIIPPYLLNPVSCRTTPHVNSKLYYCPCETDILSIGAKLWFVMLKYYCYGSFLCRERINKTVDFYTEHGQASPAPLVDNSLGHLFLGQTIVSTINDLSIPNVV